MCRHTLPANPFDVLLHHHAEQSTELAGWVGISPLRDGERTYVRAHEVFQRARRCVERSKQVVKEQHDRKGIEQHAYSSSDLVWFNVRNLGLRHNSRRHKLLPKYWGPFKVVRLVGRNAVELDMPTHLRRIHPVVSTSLVKKYKHRDGHSLPPAVSDPPDKEEYEVDSIQDFNIVTHKRHGVADVVEFR